MHPHDCDCHICTRYRHDRDAWIVAGLNAQAAHDLAMLALAVRAASGS